MPFRGQLQPIEISHRMLREMDLGRRVGVRGLIAPNHFAVSVSPADLARFSGFTDALVRELAESARQHAANEGYSFPGPVEVELFEDTRLKAGRVGIAASFVEGDLVPSLILPDGGAVAIGRTPVVIGRLPECTVVLADTNISRRHAQVTVEEGDVVVTDLGSTNGTFVNGRRIARAVVKPGDEVLVGASRLRIEIR